MKTFTVVDSLFKTEPLFVLGCSHQELDAYLMKHFHVTAGDDTGHCGQMLTFQQSPWRVVWAEKIPHNFRTLGTLLHEIFHLVTRTCQDKGIPIKAQIEEGLGDETAAYLYDFFAREALRKARCVGFQ